VKKGAEYMKGRSSEDVPVRRSRRQTTDSEFVNLELSAADKLSVREYAAGLDDLDAALQAVYADGTKVTTKWDDRNNCFAAFAFPPEDSDNAGLILTGRGAGVTRALRQLAYKHNVVLQGDWAQYHNRPQGGDEDDW